MSRARGLVLQNALARYLRAHGWPGAESAGAGRPGTDITGTPGIVWENKTAGQLRIREWVTQAQSHAKNGGELPVTVYWPDGVGEQRPELALAIIPLTDFIQILRTLDDLQADIDQLQASVNEQLPPPPIPVNGG